jgi:SAP domain
MSGETNTCENIIIPNTQIKKKRAKNKTSITFTEYFERNIDLHKYKVPELKEIARKNKLYITGTKPVLIERIQNCFNYSIKVVKIQKTFRGFMVRFFLKSRGPAANNPALCVNETDGYTLEPLNEISFKNFFSYRDAKDFIYGFDLCSLVTVYKTKGKIINPYTRERVDINILNTILSLHRIHDILFSDKEPEKTNNGPVIIPLPIENNVVIQNRYTHVPRNTTAELRELTMKMQEIRTRSLSQRIQDLFIEIDLLGNYTQSSWFTSLERRDYIRFFRTLADVWNYRAQLTPATKRNICQLHDPFLNIRINAYNYLEVPLAELIAACVTVMEHMVYTGADIEYKKLGALHILSVLTVVSVPARNNMFWLYESLIY